MNNFFKNWLTLRYQKIVNSIAFYPALIALAFLLLSYAAVSFDFSERGKHFKEQLDWLSLKDASTARSIVSAIVSGIISLTVFSFSMVMIVLNQTASQMSNRILDKLIGNRFQQIVLGIYIGTIVFALFLMSSIRDVDSGIHIPSLSTYLAILLTILDIFLFIYFLHYITQSVKYQTIIQRIYKETQLNMKQCCTLKQEAPQEKIQGETFPINAPASGVYKGLNQNALIKICTENDCIIHVLVPVGSFILKGIPIIYLSKQLPQNIVKEVTALLLINDESESVINNFFYGFRQLMEVAIKALSPGINDPGTAVESLRALSKLFVYHANNYPCNTINNKENRVCIIITERTIKEIFTTTILPVWDYGKDDRMIQREMFLLLSQLKEMISMPILDMLLIQVRSKNDKVLF